MISVELHRRFKVTGPNLTNELLDHETDQLMEALLRLENDTLTDSAVSADLGKSIVEVDIVGSGETFEDALLVADSAIRSAIHEIGGRTAGWKVATTYQSAELVSA